MVMTSGVWSITSRPRRCACPPRSAPTKTGDAGVDVHDGAAGKVDRAPTGGCGIWARPVGKRCGRLIGRRRKGLSLLASTASGPASTKLIWAMGVDQRNPERNEQRHHRGKSHALSSAPTMSAGNAAKVFGSRCGRIQKWRRDRKRSRRHDFQRLHMRKILSGPPTWADPPVKVRL